MRSQVHSRNFAQSRTTTYTKSIGLFHHSVIVISFGEAQSYHIKGHDINFFNPDDIIPLFILHDTILKWHFRHYYSHPNVSLLIRNYSLFASIIDQLH